MTTTVESLEDLLRKIDEADDKPPHTWTPEEHVELAMGMFAVAQHNLQRDGHLVPVYVLVTARGGVGLVAVADQHPRALQELLSTGRFQAWAIITDSWVKMADGPLDDSLRNQRGPVRDMPGRQEGLVLTGVHRASNHTFSFSQIYDRTEPDTGAVTRLHEVKVLDQSDGATIKSWMTGPAVH